MNRLVMSDKSGTKSETPTVEKGRIGPDTSIEALARSMGVSVYELVAALRDPAIWEIIGGGFGNRRQISMDLASLDRHGTSGPGWWPSLMWNLHFGYSRHFGLPPHVINDPRYMNHIMAGLHIHTMTYMLEDKNSAQEIRNVAEKMLSSAVQNLHRHHEERLRKESSERQ